MSGMLIPAASSIALSASTNGMPSRAASRRPIDDLPAPIMPTSTSERAPSAATIAVSEIGTAVTSWLAWADIGPMGSSKAVVARSLPHWYHNPTGRNHPADRTLVMAGGTWS